MNSASYALGIAALFAGIGAIFWVEDWRYSLPTPVPPGLVQPPIGSAPRLPRALAARSSREKRPLHLHFISPDCACSRFNVEHFASLLRRHSAAVDFLVVVEGKDLDRVKRLFGRQGVAPAVVGDEGAAIARSVGVYSTPQAVILDRDGTILFRGNYNSSRYHQEKKSEYARLILDGLSARRPASGAALGLPRLPAEAFRSWGCAIRFDKEEKR